MEGCGTAYFGISEQLIYLPERAVPYLKRFMAGEIEHPDFIGLADAVISRMGFDPQQPRH